jgi:predicted membrane-bound dolichyl-phosphate-mannose-protein mannosyltransferase
LIIPMVVLVIVTPLYWRVGIVSIAVLLFAVAVSQMSKASNQELLTSVAAYAAVLTVFFGQIG